MISLETYNKLVYQVFFFFSPEFEGMWSFSQDLTAILVKQEPDQQTELSSTVPSMGNSCFQPLNLAPPPHRSSSGDIVRNRSHRNYHLEPILIHY